MRAYFTRENYEPKLSNCLETQKFPDDLVRLNERELQIAFLLNNSTLFSFQAVYFTLFVFQKEYKNRSYNCHRSKKVHENFAREKNIESLFLCLCSFQITTNFTFEIYDSVFLTWQTKNVPKISVTKP
jgi:hypothetical protein